MSSLVDSSNNVMSPYNLDDIVYVVDDSWFIPDEPSKCKVFAIHITKANSRSHFVLIDVNYGHKFRVPFYQLENKVFDSYNDAMNRINFLKI